LEYVNFIASIVSMRTWETVQFRYHLPFAAMTYQGAPADEQRPRATDYAC